MREDVMELLESTVRRDAAALGQRGPDPRGAAAAISLAQQAGRAASHGPDETHRAVPTNALRRLFAMGSLQARIGAAYALCRVRELFATDEEKRALRSKAHMAAAMRLLLGAGYLRGAVVKAAQALANYPRLSPDEYVQVLDAMHFQVPPMHFSLVREQFRRELGSEPERLFAEFDTRAFAAASLGQVHRARLRDGTDVAVKVQYPGIARAVDGDTRALAALVRSMPFLRDRAYEADVVAEIRAGLVRETDYVREARTAALVRRALVDVPDVVVPRVHERLSGKRVITMDFVDGVHVAEFRSRNPPQEVRDRVGATLMRVVERLYYSERTILGDPGAGNFLFTDDGRVGVIDFGCYRTFDDHEWDVVNAVIAAHDDPVALDRALLRCARLDHETDVDPEHLESVRRSTAWYLESMQRDEPFDFGNPAYLQRGMDATRRVLERRHTRQMPVFVWQTRCFMGLRVLLHRLGARVNQFRIDEEERARAAASAAR